MNFFFPFLSNDCIKGYQMVFASTCEYASSAFSFASTSSDQICLASSEQRAASTLTNTVGEQRALRKFSKRNLDFSLLKSQQLAYSQFCLVGNDVKLRPVALRELQCGTLEVKEIQRFLYRHCEPITERSLKLPDFQVL